MNCACGFKFSGPGEYRNCEAFVTSDGQSGIICPNCGNCYVNGQFAGKAEEFFDKRNSKE